MRPEHEYFWQTRRQQHQREERLHRRGWQETCKAVSSRNVGVKPARKWAAMRRRGDAACVKAGRRLPAEQLHLPRPIPKKQAFRSGDTAMFCSRCIYSWPLVASRAQYCNMGSRKTKNKMPQTSFRLLRTATNSLWKAWSRLRLPWSRNGHPWETRWETICWDPKVRSKLHMECLDHVGATFKTVWTSRHVILMEFRL